MSPENQTILVVSCVIAVIFLGAGFAFLCWRGAEMDATIRALCRQIVALDDEIDAMRGAAGRAPLPRRAEVTILEAPPWREKPVARAA